MPPKTILILGGGTAGWMTASLLAKLWGQNKNTSVTLLESPDIGTIGVGEGSTPSIREFFNILGITEDEWMPRCNATYKNGITFSGWSSQKGYESYFHPFYSDVDNVNQRKFIQSVEMRRKGFCVESHPDHFFVMKRMTDQGLSPIPNDNFPFNMGYSYHFDSTLLGQFLREKSIDMGVSHEEGTVLDIRQKSSGEVAEVITKCGKKIAADLFFDCTGFSSLLLRKTLNTEFVSFSDHMLNNAAVAIPSPLYDGVKPETVSAALSSGWAWQIPLTNRIGNGYVYSSDHLNPEQAERELRNHIGIEADSINARHLRMELGYIKKFWNKNCIAIGLSQGFIEPLEATALHFVYKSITHFIEFFENSLTPEEGRDEYNKKMETIFNRTKDYIHLHYLTNTRKDTQYWQDARRGDAISDSLQNVMNAWQNGENLEREIIRQDIGRYYHQNSWYCMLSGVGFLPKSAGLKRQPNSFERINLKTVKQFNERCCLNFKKHPFTIYREHPAS